MVKKTEVKSSKPRRSRSPADHSPEQSIRSADDEKQSDVNETPLAKDPLDPDTDEVTLRLGLKFAVHATRKAMRIRKVAEKISLESAIVLSAFFDFFIEELLISVSDAMRRDKAKLIYPVHIRDGIISDSSFFSFFRDKSMMLPTVDPMHMEIYKFTFYERSVFDTMNNRRVSQ